MLSNSESVTACLRLALRTVFSHTTPLASTLLTRLPHRYNEVANRLQCPKSGHPMLLKLKDYPSKAHFKDSLPAYFQDFMCALPVKPYTSCQGALNCATYLPDAAHPPDMGPKLYMAYGGLQLGDRVYGGCTECHLDASDAVNLLADCGVSSEHSRFKPVLHDFFDSRSDVTTVEEGLTAWAQVRFRVFVLQCVCCVILPCRAEQSCSLQAAVGCYGSSRMRSRSLCGPRTRAVIWRVHLLRISKLHAPLCASQNRCTLGRGRFGTFSGTRTKTLSSIS